MADKPEFVQIKLPSSTSARPTPSIANKALQLKIGSDKTVVVYNHVQGYILDALMKAVFSDAH